jgi:hypothetical protein
MANRAERPMELWNPGINHPAILIGDILAKRS